MLKNLKSDQARTIVETYLKIVRELLFEHYGPKALALVHDEKKMRIVFSFLYRFLPLPVRVLYRRKKFVSFCMKHKATLLARLDLTLPKT